MLSPIVRPLSSILIRRACRLCLARAFHFANLHGSVEERAWSTSQSGSETLNRPSPSLSPMLGEVIPGCRLERFRKTVLFPASLLTFNALLRGENTSFSIHRWCLCSSEHNRLAWWIIHFIEIRKCHVKKAKTRSLLPLVCAQQTPISCGVYFPDCRYCGAEHFVLLEKVFYLTEPLKAAAVS